MTINAQSRFAEKMTLENIYTHVHSKYLKVYQMKGCSQINSQEINQTLSGKDGVYTIMSTLPKACGGLEYDESKND